MTIMYKLIKDIYPNMFVLYFVFFSILTANSIHTSSNANLGTTIPPTTKPKEGMRCFKCTSWTNNQCTKTVSMHEALQYLPTVWCSADCFMMVVDHDGVTDVIRGCSTGGAEVEKTTCYDDYCNLNHGTSFRTSSVYTTLIMAFLYAVLGPVQEVLSCTNSIVLLLIFTPYVPSVRLVLLILKKFLGIPKRKILYTKKKKKKYT